jgi:PhnB protein
MDNATAKPVPQGYHTITPWIITKHAADLIVFLEKAFDAQETPGTRFYNADGSIGHVEARIGNSVVMLFDSKETWPPPQHFCAFMLVMLTPPTIAP